MTLEDWLERCERLHPVSIDMGLDRVQAVRDRLGLAFECPVITVAGTNGKGSTCAMLESIASQAGYRVGLYSSPHLLHFEERCRVAGESVSASELLPHFEAVEAARQDTSLTYFEFTTLVILRLLSRAGLDLVVLEVGLGGRLDAVNVIDADVALITSVDIDHQSYLGPDRETIGREKAGILRAGRPAVIADPVPPQSVIACAQEIGADLRLLARDFHFQGDSRQWGWAGRTRRVNGMAYPALRGANQLLNASGALAAFEALGHRLPIPTQAVRNGLAMVELPGRFQIVPGAPTLVLDVAHNPHAVATLARNLDQMGFFPRTHAVFGAMHDKDAAGMLLHMRPLVDHWYFSDLPTPRAARATDLEDALDSLPPADPSTTPAASRQRHGDPNSALRAALEAADPADRIIVFGSFFTVSGVMRDGPPRLAAKHLH